MDNFSAIDIPSKAFWKGFDMYKNLSLAHLYPMGACARVCNLRSLVAPLHIIGIIFKFSTKEMKRRQILAPDIGVKVGIANLAIFDSIFS